MSERLEATEETVLDAYRSGTLTSALFSYANYGNEELRRICIDLHNAKQIDLLKLVHRNEFNTVSNTRFFAGQKFFDDVIPELAASVPAMMRCVKALVDRGGRDLAANFPLESFRAWCGRDLERAREVISIAQSNEEAANGFLAAALIVGNYEDDARYFALGYRDNRQLAGVFALGRIARTSVSDADTALALLEQLVLNSDAELLYANVLLAGLELAKNYPGSDPDTLSRIASRICGHPSSMVLDACCQAILLYPTQLTNQILTSLLRTLQALPTTQKGSLSTLDAALSQLLNGNNADRAIDFIADYLRSNREMISLPEFGSFESSLRRNSAQLQKVLLSWMLLGDMCLCEGVARLFRNGEDKPYHFDVSVSYLSPADQVFVCRKVLGHLFMQPNVASSFVVCVLRQCDEQTAGLLSQLLLDVILRNYSGSVRKYLSSIPPEDLAFGRLQPALIQCDVYLADLESVGIIKEMHPSESARQAVMLRDFDQMQDARKRAEQESVLLSMVSRSVILHGRKTLSYMGFDEGDREPMEMELHPHSFTFEMPRQEFLDPVSTDYLIRVLRSEGRTA